MKKGPQLSEHALLVLQERYLRRDESGRVVEAPAELFQRVAAAVAAPARRFGEDAAAPRAKAARLTDPKHARLEGQQRLFPARIGVPYDSEPGLALGARIGEFLGSRARTMSIELGERRGSFPAFADSVWPARGLSALRNATVTCVAPTGTLSLLAGTSSGIEPYFALAMERRVLDGRTLLELSGAVEEALERFPAARAEALDTLSRTGSLKEMAGLLKALRRRFPIALEIAPEWHLRMQAAFQAHVDAAVSKTVNLPADAPVAAVRRAFDLARRLRLKGLTVYRCGCRPEQVLSLVHPDTRHDCRECAV